MGGGSSKEDVKAKAKSKLQKDVDAFANYAGPAKQPLNQSSTIESPQKRPAKAPVPGMVDDAEPDDQRPAQIAKQVRMSQQSLNNSIGSPPMKSQKQLDLEKQKRFQLELQKSQEQAKQRELQMKKEKEAQDAISKKKEQEQEKIRQLQLIRQQQKQKEAQDKAAAAAAQQQQQFNIQASQGSEVFAQHYSPNPSMSKSIGRSDVQSSHGTMGNINSPMKGQQQNGQFDMGVNGRGMNRGDSFQMLQNQQQSYMPKPQIQFKVINYNEEQAQNERKRRDLDDSGYGGGMATYKKPTQSGIHIGMDQKEYNKDAEQNRNIDMAELNELLGI